MLKKLNKAFISNLKQTNQVNKGISRCTSKAISLRFIAWNNKDLNQTTNKEMIGLLQQLGYMTYPSLNLIRGTLLILEMERAGKLSRTAKFEVCSIEIYNINLVAVQISDISRGFVWENVAGRQGLPSSHISRNLVIWKCSHFLNR